MGGINRALITNAINTSIRICMHLRHGHIFLKNAYFSAARNPGGRSCWTVNTADDTMLEITSDRQNTIPAHGRLKLRILNDDI